MGGSQRPKKLSWRQSRGSGEDTFGIDTDGSPDPGESRPDNKLLHEVAEIFIAGKILHIRKREDNVPPLLVRVLPVLLL